MATTSDLRTNIIIRYNGQLHRVVEFHHHAPGNWRAMVILKLKNMQTGKVIEDRVRAGSDIEIVRVDKRPMQYLYRDGDSYHFMNTENFDQLEMSEDDLGDTAQWVAPGMKIIAEFFNGRPIGIQLPNAMTFEVVETNPVMKTATKTSSFKPAKLDNGVTINVPEFIQTGEKVRVNPSTGDYIDRAK